jgi:transposase
MLKRGEDYTWSRPALHARKVRGLELKAGLPARRGQRGSAQAYNLPATREAERRRAAEGEAAYRRLTDGWRPRGPKRARMSAAKEERP